MLLNFSKLNLHTSVSFTFTLRIHSYCRYHPSYLNRLQFYSQTVVFWKKISVSGLCLLQLSFQFSFIFSAPFLEFTQFLLYILSTKTQFHSNRIHFNESKQFLIRWRKKILLASTESSTPLSNTDSPTQTREGVKSSSVTAALIHCSNKHEGLWADVVYAETCGTALLLLLLNIAPHREVNSR